MPGIPASNATKQNFFPPRNSEFLIEFYSLGVLAVAGRLGIGEGCAPDCAVPKSQAVPSSPRNVNNPAFPAIRPRLECATVDVTELMLPEAISIVNKFFGCLLTANAYF